LERVGEQEGLGNDKQTNSGQSRTPPIGGSGQHEQIGNSFPPQDSNPHHTAAVVDSRGGRSGPWPPLVTGRPKSQPLILTMLTINR